MSRENKSISRIYWYKVKILDKGDKNKFTKTIINSCFKKMILSVSYWNKGSEFIKL